MNSPNKPSRLGRDWFALPKLKTKKSSKVLYTGSDYEESRKMVNSTDSEKSVQSLHITLEPQDRSTYNTLTSAKERDDEDPSSSPSLSDDVPHDPAAFVPYDSASPISPVVPNPLGRITTAVAPRDLKERYAALFSKESLTKALDASSITCIKERASGLTLKEQDPVGLYKFGKFLASELGAVRLVFGKLACIV